MIVFRWRCWLRAVWSAIKNPPALTGLFAGAAISGHDYKRTEDWNVRALVDVLRCEDCGGYSIGWRKDGSHGVDRTSDDR